jgi:hypothetical protein
MGPDGPSSLASDLMVWEGTGHTWPEGSLPQLAIRSREASRVLVPEFQKM